MTITISPDVEAKAREKAAAEGISVETYVERLILEDEWIELHEDNGDEEDSEFDDIRKAVTEGFEQFERGEVRPAREFFADLRVKYGSASRG